MITPAASANTKVYPRYTGPTVGVSMTSATAAPTASQTSSGEAITRRTTGGARATAQPTNSESKRVTEAQSTERGSGGRRPNLTAAKTVAKATVVIAIREARTLVSKRVRRRGHTR